MLDPTATTPGSCGMPPRSAGGRDCAIVYAGNLPGRVGDLEDTHCTSCGRVLIARFGYHIREYHVTEDGRCPGCQATVPGRWDRAFGGQITSHPFLPHDRTRLRMFYARAWLAHHWSRDRLMICLDALQRPLANLRLSVTDRCNLRCQYCMPEQDYVVAAT